MSVLQLNDIWREAAERASTGWMAYETVVAALGGDRMQAAVLEAANRIADVDEVFAFERFASERPHPILSAGSAPGPAHRAELYAERFYGLDPAAKGFMVRRSSGVIAQRVIAEQIEDSDYRRECYDEPGLSEKVTVALRDGQTCVVLNFYRLRRRPRLGGQSCAALVRFAELVLPLVRRHVELADRSGSKRPAAEQMERKLTKLHPGLTARERAVVARTLLGLTSRAIAAEFGLGATSVMTYRRRAYQKLGVNSAAELVASLLG